MIDFFDSLYMIFRGKNRVLNKIYFYSIMRLVIRILANLILPVYLSVTKNNKKYILEEGIKEKERIIVSLTTFPLRIGKVWMVIETLLRQTVKPDLIILWLSKEQFPSLNSLPKNLIRLQKRGLKIEIRDGDLKSHKKYYYVLKEYPNDMLLTVDDDIFYRSKMIQYLLDYNKINPDIVGCTYARMMEYDNNVLLPYSEWEHITECIQLDDNLFFGSGGGTLFPVQILPSETLNEQVFMKYCASADDIWLNTMIRLNNKKISKVYKSNIFLPIMNSKDIPLAKVNLNENMNDEQIQNIREYYRNSKQIDPFI